MSYSLQITAIAEGDLCRAADYIDRVLKNPQAADRLYEEVGREVASLACMPQRYAIADDPFLASHVIRALRVHNYLVFYRVSVESQTVTILRVLYGKSDWQTILRQSLS